MFTLFQFKESGFRSQRMKNKVYRELNVKLLTNSHQPRSEKMISVFKVQKTTRQDQTRPDKIRQDQTRPNKTRQDQTRPDKTRPDQTRPD